MRRLDRVSEWVSIRTLMTNRAQIAVIDNAQQPLSDLLTSELAYADCFSVASAFLNSGGLRVVEGGMRRILENEGRVSVIHGADFRVTDPEAVETLVEMKARFAATMTYRVYVGWDLLHRQRFHPKLYITTADYKDYCAIVGSSNLTLGGLRDNAEVDVVIRGRKSDEPIRQCRDIFQSISNYAALVEPSTKFVEMYADLYEQAVEMPLSDAPPSDLAEMYKELNTFVRTRNPTRRPRTQTDYVVIAIANLLRRPSRIADIYKLMGRPRYEHLEDIYREAESVARGWGENYKWNTFDNSVRRAVYDHLGKGRNLFERGDSGMYRLSELGWKLAEEFGA